jgi:hypothetical protein
MFIAQAFSQDHFFTRVSMTCAASYSSVRIIPSSQRETHPMHLLSPDWERARVVQETSATWTKREPPSDGVSVANMA